MEFEKVNMAMLLGIIGLIAIALALVFTKQDGALLKICLVLLGMCLGLPLQLPDFFKKEENK
jgi:hypothetical protein